MGQKYQRSAERTTREEAETYDDTAPSQIEALLYTELDRPHPPPFFFPGEGFCFLLVMFLELGLARKWRFHRQCHGQGQSYASRLAQRQGITNQ